MAEAAPSGNRGGGGGGGLSSASAWEALLREADSPAWAQRARCFEEVRRGPTLTYTPPLPHPPVSLGSLAPLDCRPLGPRRRPHHLLQVASRIREFVGSSTAAEPFLSESGGHTDEPTQPPPSSFPAARVVSVVLRHMQDPIFKVMQVR